MARRNGNAGFDKPPRLIFINGLNDVGMVKLVKTRSALIGIVALRPVSLGSNPSTHINKPILNGTLNRRKPVFCLGRIKKLVAMGFLIPRIGIEHLKQQGGAYDVVRNCGSFRIYGFCLDKN